MMRLLSLLCCVALLSACGFKRPLIAPKDIPEYEESLRNKREELMKQQDVIDRANAAQKMPDNAAKASVPSQNQGNF